jgi:glycerol-1-phosphatase
MNSNLRGSARPLNESFDAALVDLDGVAYRGPGVVPSAPPALASARAQGMRLVFVTNNASRSAEDVAAHLREVGIEASPREVFTSAQAAVEILATRFAPGDKVLVVGGPGLRDLVVEEGFQVVDSANDAPVVVVQGWHPDVGWRQLAEAAYAVRGGATYLVTNRDLTFPNDRGIAPGNGSFVRAVVTASGIEPENVGKPEPGMFRLAAARFEARTPLVVGDRLDTDLGGANAAGYPSLLVLTGVSSASDAILAIPAERPSFIGMDLASLGESHPAPIARDGWWTVGDARACVRDGALVLDGVGGIDGLRAACAAAWEAADRASDQGEVVHIESLSTLGLE